MMPNVTRGGRMYGLVKYLLGDGRHNVHTDQRVIGGDPVVQAWFADEAPSTASMSALARYLDEPAQVYGTQIKGPISRFDEAAGQMVKVGEGDAHVWHCSLSLRASEGALPDSTWAAIAGDFVREMGFDGADGRSPCRWVAVHHGASAGGNDHVHIAVNLVREDGTKARTWRDWPRAQDTARKLEQAYGLEVLESRTAGLGERGAKPGELAAAAAGTGETTRDRLARRVRAAAAAAGSEDEFVRRARRDGLLVRPRYAAGSHDVVAGYSAAERPAAGERPVWFGGGQLARDLTLPRLRQGWPDTPEGATVAAAEWGASARGQAPTTDGPEAAEPAPDAWVDAAGELAALREQLRSVPVDDVAAWTHVAGLTAGALSAWSVRVEPTPGPLAAAARTLARTSQVRAHVARPPARGYPRFGGVARILLAGAGGATAEAVLLRQLLNTARALYDMHQAAGRVQEAARIEAAVRTQLVHVARRLPEVPANVLTPSPTSHPPTIGPRRGPIPDPLAPRPRTTTRPRGPDVQR
jgi:hypothetical protein